MHPNACRWWAQRKAAEHLKVAVELLSEDAEFSPGAGYTWRSVREVAGGEGVDSSSVASTAVARAEATEKRYRVDSCLAKLYQEVGGLCRRRRPATHTGALVRACR